MVLVNRDIELDHLKSALAECGGVRSRTIVVEGGVGCGKSALLTAFAEYATDEGAVVLRARGMGADVDPAMTVVQQLAPQVAAALPCEPGEPDARYGFTEALRRLAARGTVVICVDDAQDTDRTSLFELLQAAGRGRSSRTLLVFADSLHLPQRDPVIKMELLRQSDSLRIRLGLLDKKGIAALLDAQGGDPGDRPLVGHLQRISAGNPLLLKALLEECRRGGGTTARPVDEVQPMEGGMYSQAVLACLYRSGEVGMRLGQTIAVLGESVSLEPLSRISGLASALIDQNLHAMRMAGLIDGLAFRHQAAVATVLADMDPAARTELHRKAATVLYETGASSAVIAAQLLPARRGSETWERSALCNAAEDALGEDDAARAIDLLELALESCTDEAQRIEIRLRLALITGRINPAAAEYRHLPELLASMRAGALTPAALGVLARLLVAHGWIDDAMDVLQRQGIGVDTEGPADEGTVRPAPSINPTIAWIWVRYGFHSLEFPDEEPGLTAPPGPKEEGSVPVPGVPQLKRSAEHVLAGDRDGWVSTAENFLRVTALTDSTVGPVCSAIKALLFADRLESAWQWSEKVIQESRRRGITGWQAMFAVVQGLIAVRQGKLEEGLARISQAKTVVLERNRSVLVCLTDAVLALIYTEMGRFDDAARLFDKPVPEMWEKSIYWLSYLRARGCFRLATDRPHAALSDFLRVGRLAARLGIDQPLMVSWRSDAAEAWLRLNEPEQAAQLLTAQDGKDLPGTGRSRGVSLRLQAAIAPTADRPRLLAGAVELLHESGDRLELAKAFADLADAHEALGDAARADVVRRRAWHLAEECGAAPLSRRLDSGGRHTVPTVRESAEASRTDGSVAGSEATSAGRLTRAEHRVAELAAHGRTNREISERLYITVSTVEQHLTRVYQKLRISRREEIPVNL